MKRIYILVVLAMAFMATSAYSQYYPSYDRVVFWAPSDTTGLEIWDGETRAERPYLTIVEAWADTIYVGVIMDELGTAEEDTLAASPTWREFRIPAGESEAIPGLVRYLYASGNAAWTDTVAVKIYRK